MKVVRAESAGFCMGVARALRKLGNLLSQEDDRSRIVTFGPIIHNPQVLAEYAAKGVKVSENIDEICPGATVVVRAHGIPKLTQRELGQRGATILDATCPRVKKAQMLIAHHSKKGRTLLLLGEKNHPEVKGLLSYAGPEAIVFESASALKDINLPKGPDYFLAAQTTQDLAEFEKVRLHLCELFGREPEALDTICDATMRRQEETIAIAAQVDCMIVVGGFESGNTRRLVKVAQMQGAKCLHVETAAEINLEQLSNCVTIGLTAGASTPKNIIDDVHFLLSSL